MNDEITPYINDQIERLEFLLGKYKFEKDKFSPEEFNELKDIVAIWSPYVNTKNEKDIIKAGLITVGIYSLVRLLTSV